MTDLPPDDVIALSDRFRAALLSKDLAAQKRIIGTYQTIYGGLQDKIELLLLEIEKRGGTMSRGQVVRLAQYKNLMDGVEKELTGYGVVVKTELSQASQAAIAQSTADARRMIEQAIITNGGQIQYNALRSLDPRVIEQLLGFLSPEGELYKRIDAMPAWTASQVSDAIIDGVAVGKNPRTIANMITTAFGGSLTDAMRMVRTSQLWAYREATRATYAANSDIVSGWVWHSALDGRTCPSCIAMHGTEHSHDEPLNDHHNGRCAMVPITVLNPTPNIEKGSDWFNKQPESVQRDILGKGRFEAWKGGKFQLSDVVGQHKDGVYGDMRVPRPLKDILRTNRAIEYIEAQDIIPVNEITDNNKYKALVRSMKEENWKGREILAIQDGENYQALTGSHRIHAAREAGVEVKTNVIDTSKMTKNDIDRLINAKEDGDRLDILEEYKKRGIITSRQFELIELEEKENARDIGRSAYYKKQAALYDSEEAARKAARVEEALKAKQLELEAKKLADEIKLSSNEKKELDDFVARMKAKYTNIWADMTDEEMAIYEKLESALAKAGR